ncbi:regulatory protein, LysR:LysR, substrate-binding [Pseudooceanicola batsensis HTCC2597]|uniref:Regulatory protein, LysR:LysR, substrate-binding n=1 Tax=Pseudooceanicola batsensis (strain ATCC BAA-863 / DSM 15984 / KCTC 12145 / HTCC2597) TaxID=252305 RepID=A3U1I2_PSEBH|nr:LysR family transcriptional regulator [Pseudooceanicola batsensis]EAQ02165.1 regulatory protein, LysR:LysR, substrate-binding [Pseudooceanicola batsensis HTCC2597]
MDLKQLSYFMLIHEHGSISKAASAAGVVQPALSSQIRKLEAEFGVPLFVRTHRGVVPTSAGDRIYQLAASITANIADAKQDLSALVEADQVGGRIKVGFPPSLARGIFSPLMTSFTNDFPNVKVTMMEAFSGTLTEWVIDGRIDFAIGAVPLDVAGLRQRKIYTDNIVLISGQPIAGKQLEPCRLDNIPGLKLILPSEAHSFGAVVRKYLEEGRIVADSTVEVDGASGGIALARSTDWAGLCPFCAVHGDLRRNQIYVNPIAAPELKWDLYLLYDEKRPLTAAAHRFIAMVERELAELKKVWTELSRTSSEAI